jgi:lipoprotein NlpI
MHPDYASSLNNIGITYESKGDYGKSLEFFEGSFKIIQNLYS